MVELQVRTTTQAALSHDETCHIAGRRLPYPQAPRGPGGLQGTAGDKALLTLF